MLTLRNPFYRDPEANARLLLQQQMMCDAQRTAEQALADAWALSALAARGQLCLCIPLGGPAAAAAAAAPPAQPFPFPEPYAERGTKLRVCVDRPKSSVLPSKSDSCEYRADEVEIVLDLRSILPADVAVHVEERRIRVEANASDGDGVKTYWRQYDLPACVSCDLARCVLGRDGFLRVSAPWFKME